MPTCENHRCPKRPPPLLQATSAFIATCAKMGGKVDLPEKLGGDTMQLGKDMCRRAQLAKAEALIMKAWKSSSRRVVVEKQLRYLTECGVDASAEMHPIMWASVSDVLTT